MGLELTDCFYRRHYSERRKDQPTQKPTHCAGRIATHTLAKDGNGDDNVLRQDKRLEESTGRKTEQNGRY